MLSLEQYPSISAPPAAHALVLLDSHVLWLAFSSLFRCPSGLRKYMAGLLPRESAPVLDTRVAEDDAMTFRAALILVIWRHLE